MDNFVDDKDIKLPVSKTIYVYDSNLCWVSTYQRVFASQSAADSYQLKNGESYDTYITIYYADNVKVFAGIKMMSPNYQLGELETLTKPETAANTTIMLDDDGKWLINDDNQISIEQMQQLIMSQAASIATLQKGS